MTIRYSFLSQSDFPEAHATMVEAFADYHLDMSYMTSERSRLRNVKSGVHYDCSVAAYDGQQMVGVTFVGLDDWLGEKAAYDAGTGIIPAYRGQGIAKGMFEFVLPKLKCLGVSQFLLEVLQPNTAAIRAYSKTGFEVTREFACLDLSPDDFKPVKQAGRQLDIKTIDRSVIESFVSQVDYQPSWEISFAGMQRIEDDLICLGAFDENRCVGIVVYYPLLQWLMSLVVVSDSRRMGVASSLMEALLLCLPEGADKVKVINIDHGDLGMLEFMEKAGAQHVINQFEMKYSF